MLAIASTRQLDENVFYPFFFFFFFFSVRIPLEIPGKRRRRRRFAERARKVNLDLSRRCRAVRATRRFQRPGLERSRKGQHLPPLVYPRVALFYDFIGINESRAVLASRLVKSYSQLLDSTRVDRCGAKLFRPRLHVVGITGISASVRFNEIIGEPL